MVLADSPHDFDTSAKVKITERMQSLGAPVKIIWNEESWAEMTQYQCDPRCGAVNPLDRISVEKHMELFAGRNQRTKSVV